MDDIKQAVQSIRPQVSLRAYLFGSAMKKKEGWTDIDIVIICDVSADVKLVRPALHDACLNAPIDLMIMSAAEERELNFVAEQQCRLLCAVDAAITAV